MATLVFPFINIFLVKRRNKVRNSVKLIRFRMVSNVLCPLWYVHVTCTCTVHVRHPCVACLFPTVFGSVRVHVRTVWVQHVLGFLSHKTWPTHRQRLYARNKISLASRLAQSIRSQPIINTGRYQMFKHPHYALSTNRNSETVCRSIRLQLIISKVKTRPRRAFHQ